MAGDLAKLLGKELGSEYDVRHQMTHLDARISEPIIMCHRERRQWVAIAFVEEDNVVLSCNASTSPEGCPVPQIAYSDPDMVRTIKNYVMKYLDTADVG